MTTLLQGLIRLFSFYYIHATTVLSVFLGLLLRVGVYSLLSNNEDAPNTLGLSEGILNVMGEVRKVARISGAIDGQNPAWTLTVL